MSGFSKQKRQPATRGIENEEKTTKKSKKENFAISLENREIREKIGK